jgi:hypothetical protein
MQSDAAGVEAAEPCSSYTAALTSCPASIDSCIGAASAE